MANNYEDYGYEDSDNKGFSIKRIILIIVFILIALFLVLFLIKGCNKKDKTTSKPSAPVVPKETFKEESAILQAGKTYFENNIEKYPTSTGQCSEVTLQELIAKGLVNVDKFSNCNQTATVLKVCILENGNKHYTPWINCPNLNSDTKYDSEKEGTINDVVADESLIKFEFLPQGLKKGDNKLGPVEEIWKDEVKYKLYKTLSTTNYYRYMDKLYTWNVNNNYYYTSKGETTNASSVKEYYAYSPNSSYKLTSDKTTGYKWYTTTASKKIYAIGANGGKIYLPEGQTLPGYPNYLKSEGVCSSYQTRSVTSTYKPYHFYKCKSNVNNSYKYQSNVACGQGIDPQYSIKLDEFYTCGKGSISEIEGKRTTASVCKEYSEWEYILTTCNTNLDTCRKTSQYCVYPRFKIQEGTRKYYPSGSSSASGEKIYYTSSPVKDAVKDVSTKITVYKWYRSVNKSFNEYTATPPKGYPNATKTNNYKYTTWSNWSTKNPKVSDGRERKIETKQKIKLQEIQGVLESGFEDLSTKYMTESELIEFFKSKGYKVNSLTDINNNGEIKYKVKMLIRNKKGGN